MPKEPHFTSDDLRGMVRLLTEATLGVTAMVEAMHRGIVHPPFLPSTPVQHLITGIAGISYQAIGRISKMVGWGLDKGLHLFSPPAGETTRASSAEREAALAALNGLLGDYLEQSQNPLAIPMQFRYEGTCIKPDSTHIRKRYARVTGHILLMVHGLCMNDLQWQRNDHDHGKTLAKELDLTPVYLYYNGGRHVSINGQELNVLLEQLVSNWPVPVESLRVVAHSMGGLVCRSACWYGAREQQNWIRPLKKMVFLGTPHHGAPLEQAGNYVDNILEAIPYAKPFARLGKIRSAGITDLRYGSLREEDWQGADRFELRPNNTLPIPLPHGIDCFALAASTGKSPQDDSARFLGDGLVLLDSALGKHKDPEKDLAFPEAHTWVAYESHHMDLLSNPAVFSKLRSWLSE